MIVSQHMNSPKKLEDMSLEELWELFPIRLMPHNPEWKEWAHIEIESLAELLADHSPLIHHIGSTAVPGIAAKPIVDILVEVPEMVDWKRIRELMEGRGYICMSVSPGSMSFNKGYTPKGYAARVFHIHFHSAGDNAEIYFRDYLISHPGIAHEYETLKRSLLPRFSHDRDGYTSAKSAFIRRVTNMARDEMIKPEI